MWRREPWSALTNMEINTMRTQSITSLVNKTGPICILNHCESALRKKQKKTTSHLCIFRTSPLGDLHHRDERQKNPVGGGRQHGPSWMVQSATLWELWLKWPHGFLNPLYFGSSGTVGCTAWQTIPPPHTRQSPRSSWPRSTRSTWVPHRSSTCPTQPHARRSTSGFHPKPELRELALHICKLWSPASCQ